MLLPYNFSLHMYKFPSAGDDSCLSVVYTDNVYHWAVLDYFYTCLFYTVHRPTWLGLRFTCLTDVCGNQLEATDCLTPLQSALEKGGGASVTNTVSKYSNTQRHTNGVQAWSGSECSRLHKNTLQR